MGTVIGLITYGANKEAVNDDGNAPWQLAVMNAYYSVMVYLINHAHRVSSKKRYGPTMLITAAGNGDKDKLLYLLGVGTSMRDGDIDLLNAACYGREEVVAYLTSNGMVPNNHKKERREAVKALVGNCFSVNAQDSYGNTALIAAAGNGHLDLVDFLIEQGADQNIKNNDGETALIVAATNNHDDVMDFLIENEPS